jgi:hypothetical protein
MPAPSVAGPVSSVSAAPKSVSGVPKPAAAEKPAAAPVAVEADDEESSPVWNIIAIVAALLALGMAGYLFYAMSSNVVS